MMLRFLHSYMYMYLFKNSQYIVISCTFSNLNEVKNPTSRDFLTILGRGPRAFLIGTISEVNSELGNFKF